MKNHHENLENLLGRRNQFNIEFKKQKYVSHKFFGDILLRIGYEQIMQNKKKVPVTDWFLKDKQRTQPR